MSMIRLIILPLLLMLGGCASRDTHWNPVPATTFDKPLTLEQAVSLAAHQDLRVAEWKARYQSAQSAVQQAWLPPNPTLNLAWEDIGLKDAAGKSASTSTVGVSYPILFWITRPWEIASARHRKRAEELAIESEKRDLAIEVGQRWFEIATLSQKEELARLSMGQAEDGLRYTQAFRDSGGGSQVEVKRSEADLLQSQSELADITMSKRSAQLALAFALGADTPFYPEVEASLDGDIIKSISPRSIEETSAQQPDVISANESARAIRADLSAEYARTVPLTDSQGSAGRKHARDGNSTNYGLDIPIPIFDWNQAGISQARAAENMAQISAERTRREATRRQADAWDRWESTATKYKSISRLLRERAETVASDGKELFEAGRITYADYLQLRRDSIAQQMIAVDAWSDARIAEWTLLMLNAAATGKKR